MNAFFEERLRECIKTEHATAEQEAQARGRFFHDWLGLRESFVKPALVRTASVLKEAFEEALVEENHGSITLSVVALRAKYWMKFSPKSAQKEVQLEWSNQKRGRSIPLEGLTTEIMERELLDFVSHISRISACGQHNLT